MQSARRISKRFKSDKHAGTTTLGDPPQNPSRAWQGLWPLHTCEAFTYHHVPQPCHPQLITRTSACSLAHSSTDVRISEQLERMLARAGEGGASLVTVSHHKRIHELAMQLHILCSLRCHSHHLQHQLPAQTPSSHTRKQTCCGLLWIDEWQTHGPSSQVFSSSHQGRPLIVL